MRRVSILSRINAIQNGIKELDGGSFQKLFDAYLHKKYQFENIQPLGVQTGTNKPTKGTPDSFVKNEDGTFILIMYGSVEDAPVGKMKKDILSCFDEDKLELPQEKITKIICAYSSTNIHIEQIEELENLIEDINIEMIGLGTISNDLLVNYPFLAAEFLNIPIDTEQIYDIEDFIKVYDKNGMNAPLNMKFWGRETELDEVKSGLFKNIVTLLTGNSGTGKTRIALEICTQFQTNGWKVFCVKNNGELLYNDLKYYISDPGDYLLFIDDANHTTSLQYVMDFIINPPEGIYIKVLMTIRDYAKYRVKSLVCNYEIPSEVKISSLESKIVKQILMNNLGIQNDDYLDRIVKISKGNIRLAILAGKISIEKGYLAINNAMDIFENYYGKVINSQKLNEVMVNALFVIALLGPLRFKDSKITMQILEDVNINESEFIEICHELNSKELIDMYQDEAVKVSDQSLGNYIIEYVLIEKKTISLSKLLDLGFSRFKNKLLYAINTLISIFNSDKVKEYIERQVNESWNLASPELQLDYLTCFHALNEEKSLCILKRSIDEMKIVSEDLTKFSFDNKKNNHNIKMTEVKILCGYKYSEYYCDAIELLFVLFDKRPDSVMDFYFAFTDELSYDKYSYTMDYCKEYELIESMWKHSNEGKNINITILILHIFGEFLKCSFNKTEAGENARSINFIRLNIFLTDGCKKIRLLIWRALEILYKNDLYREFIERILSTPHGSGLQEKACKEVITYDCDCIKRLFVDTWEIPSFEQCKVLYDIEKHLIWLDIKYDEIFCKYKQCRDFLIYKTLIKEHIERNTWEDNEADRRKEIENLVKSFTDEDYRLMFKICNEQLEKKDRKEWLLQSGISVVFSTLEGNISEYINVVKIYLESGAPYSNYPERIIYFLIKNLGLKETEMLFGAYNYANKRKWECLFYQLIPEGEINDNYVSKLLDFVKQELELDNPIFPSASYLGKYKYIENDIVGLIGKIILKASDEKPYFAADFLERLVDDEKINYLINIFEGNISILEKLYLAAMGDNFDYYGKLLEVLVHRNIDFWNQFTIKLAENIHRNSYEQEAFEKMWISENYLEIISIACNNMIGQKHAYMIESEASIIFANSAKTSDEIKNRKKEWIKNYINQNFKNIERIEMIFEVVATFFQGDRMEYILEFLKCTHDIESFKNIPLFPSSSSWSGSEVPLINKKINFLEELISELKGFKYIEHRAYLKDKKNSYEKYKQSVLVREYLEDLDLA